NQQRLLHQGAGNCDALLLTTRQGASAGAQLIGEIDAGERSTRFIKLARQRPEEKAQGMHIRPTAERSGHDIVIDAQAFDEIMLLRDDRDFAPKRPQATPIADIQALAVDHDLTGLRRHAAIDGPQQCRLAGAARADKSRTLTAIQCERNIRTGLHSRSLRDHAKIDDAQQRVRHQKRSAICELEAK
ncbi:MAG: hypothetical protein Q8K85_24595, partial [Hyphomicrobium sp.]|nr:hypothetical protein [Hyphomicrobium sp.]